MDAEGNLLGDFLEQLGVKHTADYSARQFAAMPFKSLFGISKVLDSYGIGNEALRIDDKSEITLLPVPFLAHTPAGFVIVTDVDKNAISYITQGVSETMPLGEFQKAWSGNVLMAYPNEKSIEPDYAIHTRDRFITKAKTGVLIAGAVALTVYLFIANGLYLSVSTWLIAAIDILGLWLTYMLVQKSVRIKNSAADKVCGVLQAGGCDNVLEMKASKFFGIIRLERSRFLLFLSQSADVADVPSVDMLPCLMQRLLFAVYILEHLVSEIPCQGLVYALCQRTGIPLATVFLLSGRRMVQGHTPA